jgi:transcriptional regulator with XRE-family HTH domain
MSSGRPGRRPGRPRRDDGDPGAATRRALLAKNLKAARAIAGLTQEDLAHLARMQTAVYSRIERGEVDPHLSTLAKIAQALRVTLIELVGGLERY